MAIGPLRVRRANLQQRMSVGQSPEEGAQRTRAKPPNVESLTVGDKYPSAKVTGLDLSPIQPVWVPPNVEFVVEDVEEDQWIHGNDFDYIHFRATACVLKNPIQVVANAFE